MLLGVSIAIAVGLFVMGNCYLHLCYSQYAVCGEKITYCSRAIHDVVIDISYPEKASIRDSNQVLLMDPSDTSQRYSMKYRSISLLITVSADSIDCAAAVVIKV
jgi:hypothetical protein